MIHYSLCANINRLESRCEELQRCLDEARLSLETSERRSKNLNHDSTNDNEKQSSHSGNCFKYLLKKYFTKYKKQKSIFIITHFRYMHIIQNQQIWWHPQFSHLKSMGLLLVTWYVLNHQVNMKKCQIFWMRSLVTWRSIISKKNAKQKWITIFFKIQLRYIYIV